MDLATERPDPPEATARPAPMVRFTAFYVEAYQPMVRLGHLLTGSNEIGEEITQEAFAKVCRRFDEVDNPGAYVRTAVVNGCRSWQRRQRLERRWLHLQAPDTVMAGLTKGELTDVLAHLPFRQRTALILRFYEDRTTQEIADALGCRPGTAKSLVSRGLAHIREVVEP